MRYPASEKFEIIRSESALPVRRTLEKIGIPRATFYRWYDLYQAGGPEALDDRHPKPDRVWNRIPDDVRERIIRLALDESTLSAVGDRIDVLMDGGVQRGTHVLKALSVGAKAVGVGRYYLYPLAAAGQAGVERALGLMQTEIERDMKLMGCTAISQLSRNNLRFR